MINKNPEPKPLSWLEAKTIAAKIGLELAERHGMENLRIIIRALQRLTTGAKR